MYIFELQDILFTIKSIKLQTNQFNISITFSSTNTRSGASNKLLLPQHLKTTYHDILIFNAT